MESLPLIVVPAKNEAQHLPSMLSDWARAFACRSEILLVLDGCTDDSVRIARAFFEEHPGCGAWMTTDQHEHGKTGAVVQGLWRALNEGSDLRRHCVLWDADEEYDFEGLGHVLDLIERIDAMDSSYLIQGFRRGSWLRRSRWANACVRWALRKATGKEAPQDVLSAVHAMRMKDLLLALQASRGFAMETMIVRYALRCGLDQLDAPVPYRPRLEGKKIKAIDLPKIMLYALAR